MHIPVAYVLVPPGATAKTLTAEFARYLGIPTTTRMTTAQITDAVCHTYNHTGTRLILIDEIHRLNPRTTNGAEAADLLKDLTERITATFVYAGIEVTTTPLFSGIRGQQLAARASLITCGPLPARHGQAHPFRDLITGLENNLDLQAHKPGTLPRLTTYLHQRTAGRIGALTRLIRQAGARKTTGTTRSSPRTPRCMSTLCWSSATTTRSSPTPARTWCSSSRCVATWSGRTTDSTGAHETRH